MRLLFLFIISAIICQPLPIEQRLFDLIKNKPIFTVSLRNKLLDGFDQMLDQFQIPHILSLISTTKSFVEYYSVMTPPTEEQLETVRDTLRLCAAAKDYEIKGDDLKLFVSEDDLQNSDDDEEDDFDFKSMTIKRGPKTDIFDGQSKNEDKNDGKEFVTINQSLMPF
jgi:hypothetical protein